MGSLLAWIRAQWNRFQGFNWPYEQAVIEWVRQLGAALVGMPPLFRFAAFIFALTATLFAMLAILSKFDDRNKYIVFGVVGVSVFGLLFYFIAAMLHIRGDDSTSGDTPTKFRPEIEVLKLLGANGMLTHYELQERLNLTANEVDDLCGRLIAADLIREGTGIVGITTKGRDVLAHQSGLGMSLPKQSE